MSQKIRVSELPDFDVAEYLDDDQAIAEHLTSVLEENDSDLLVTALGITTSGENCTKSLIASLHRRFSGEAAPRRIPGRRRSRAADASRPT